MGRVRGPDLFRFGHTGSRSGITRAGARRRTNQ